MTRFVGIGRVWRCDGSLCLGFVVLVVGARSRERFCGRFRAGASAPWWR